MGGALYLAGSAGNGLLRDTRGASWVWVCFMLILLRWCRHPLPVDLPLHYQTISIRGAASDCRDAPRAFLSRPFLFWVCLYASVMGTVAAINLFLTSAAVVLKGRASLHGLGELFCLELRLNLVSMLRWKILFQKHMLVRALGHRRPVNNKVVSRLSKSE